MCKVLEQEGIDHLTTNEDELQQVQTKACEWYLALAFLMGADHTHYGRLLETYENNFTHGVDHYPRTMTDAFNILANYKVDEQNYMQAIWSNDGVAFTTLDDNNNHHNTNEDNVAHINDPSTTSNLTTSTNPQQHRSTLVTTGGGCGHSHTACRSAGCGRSTGHPIT